MARAVPFPGKFTPTSRTYKPGKFPQSQFQATNGATTVVQYGSRYYDSELKMTFANIRDEDAGELMELYYTVNGSWDYLFLHGLAGDDGLEETAGPIAGIKDTDLRNRIQERDRVLKYRFKEPPTLTSVMPGVSTVSLTLVGYLDGG